MFTPSESAARTNGTPQSLKSRKILGFILLVLAVLALVAVVTHLHTPEAIAINALYMIGFGGMFTIGGQALVDAILRSKWGAPSVPSESKVVTTESTVTSTKPLDKVTPYG